MNHISSLYNKIVSPSVPRIINNSLINNLRSSFSSIYRRNISVVYDIIHISLIVYVSVHVMYLAERHHRYITNRSF